MLGEQDTDVTTFGHDLQVTGGHRTTHPGGLCLPADKARLLEFGEEGMEVFVAGMLDGHNPVYGGGDGMDAGKPIVGIEPFSHGIWQADAVETECIRR